jgi:hypothetical protein
MPEGICFPMPNWKKLISPWMNGSKWTDWLAPWGVSNLPWPDVLGAVDVAARGERKIKGEGGMDSKAIYRERRARNIESSWRGMLGGVGWERDPREAAWMDGIEASQAGWERE